MGGVQITRGGLSLFLCLGGAISPAENHSSADSPKRYIPPQLAAPCPCSPGTPEGTPTCPHPPPPPSSNRTPG